MANMNVIEQKIDPETFQQLDDILVKWRNEACRLRSKLAIFEDAWLEHSCERTRHTCALCKINTAMDAFDLASRSYTGSREAE